MAGEGFTRKTDLAEKKSLTKARQRMNLYKEQIELKGLEISHGSFVVEFKVFDGVIESAAELIGQRRLTLRSS